MKREQGESQKNFKQRLSLLGTLIDRYLRGRIIPGTESRFTPKSGRYHDTKRQQNSASYRDKIFLKKRRKEKIAYRSRRINRLRATA